MYWDWIKIEVSGVYNLLEGRTNMNYCIYLSYNLNKNLDKNKI